MSYHALIYHPASESCAPYTQELDLETFTIQVFADCILLHYVVMGQDGTHDMFTSHPFTIMREGAVFFQYE
jgi:hypothetical protein